MNEFMFVDQDDYDQQMAIGYVTADGSLTCFECELLMGVAGCLEVKEQQRIDSELEQSRELKRLGYAKWLADTHRICECHDGSQPQPVRIIQNEASTGPGVKVLPGVKRLFARILQRVAG